MPLFVTIPLMFLAGSGAYAVFDRVTEDEPVIVSNNSNKLDVNTVVIVSGLVVLGYIVSKQIRRY